jgi:hypothetical protein
MLQPLSDWYRRRAPRKLHLEARHALPVAQAKEQPR